MSTIADPFISIISRFSFIVVRSFDIGTNGINIVQVRVFKAHLSLSEIQQESLVIKIYEQNKETLEAPMPMINSLSLIKTTIDPFFRKLRLMSKYTIPTSEFS